MSLPTGPISAHGAIVEVVVTLSADLLALRSEEQAPAVHRRIRALADTGASQTCLHPAVLKALGLTSIGTIEITTPLTGARAETRGRYRVALVIPARIVGESPLVFDTLEVVATELQAAYGVQALLGRDVLERCLLFYNGPERQFNLGDRHQ